MSRVIADRSYTVGLPAGGGPAVVPLQPNMPDVGRVEVIAWIGNFGGSNVYLLEGVVPLAEAVSRVADDAVGIIDCIMALSSASPVAMGIDLAVRQLTVFFESVNSAAQTEAVTVRIRVSVD